MKRCGTVGEISALIAFVASKDAGFTTGRFREPPLPATTHLRKHAPSLIYSYPPPPPHFSKRYRFYVGHDGRPRYVLI